MTDPTRPAADADATTSSAEPILDEPEIPPPWRPFVASRDLTWLRLFRSPALAMDGRKLILAAFGLMATQAGWDLLGSLFPTSPWKAPAVLRSISPGSIGLYPTDVAVTLARLIAEPYVAPLLPFARLFALGGGNLGFFHALLAGAWGLLIWGLVGGAIARIAVVQVASGDRVGIATALRFSSSRIVPLFGAPVSALIGLGFFAALCSLFGLLYQIPGPIGSTIAGVLAFLPLLAGLVMSLIVIGLAAGWPLMIATVAAEAEDGFDAVSRSYSYVYQRPGRYAIYLLTSWLLGIVGLAVALVFSSLILRLAAWGLAFGAPDRTISALLLIGADTSADSTAGSIHAGWVRLVWLLAFGYAYAYFWSAISVIYLLLRLDVDGAEIEDVALPGREDEEFVPEPRVKSDSTLEG